ncbi:uncharacterized protein YukE [Amycolatopsis lexingtonensis]|uniref:Uncharacterized protein YukE n=1 Tax=Amycolatopsis lexingtonensis TaxID=218822 RepID=A0ABR9HS10_9PSEU|nr:hypothetical protein [Amycolatopsis lexingtonensis]MBE1493706.1 uncharacterized protein YukE [Amycolatopsis lexingtonensis]
MTGFHADPAALDALARQLSDTAAEYAAAVPDLDVSDIGPPAVSGALAGLAAEWAGRIRGVHEDFAASAEAVRAAAKAYRTTDADAAEELGR